MQKKTNDFLTDLKNNPLLAIFSTLTGGCFGALLYFYHFQLPLFSKSRLVLCAFFALGVAFLIYFFLQKFTRPAYNSYKKSIRVLIIALVMAASLLLVFTFDYSIPHLYPLYPERLLRMEMNLTKLPAEIEGVSFSHLGLAYRDVSYAELEIEGLYEKHEDKLFFPAGQIASIQWQGIPGEQANLAFEPTSQSLEIQVIWDGSADNLELFQSGGVLATHTKDFPLLPNEALFIRLLSLPLIALILFVLISGLFSPRPYAFTMFTVWLFMYLLYYPGIIGDVNILAVDELIQGHPTDWHPLIYTLLVAFNIQFLASASSLLVMQFTALALIFHNAFAFLHEKGVSKTILWVLSLLIALLPTNFLSLITLTNDIPYSIALLALTYLSFKIVITNGQWLEKTSHFVLLTLTASLAILFRYNGIPAVAFFFLCLIILYPKYWLKAIISVSIVIAMWFVVTGPLYGLLNVTSQTEGHFDNILLHHISAHVSNGTPLTEEESAYLDQLLPLEEWKYSCCSNTAMWSNDNFDRDAFHTNSAYNRQLALSLFQRNPALEVSHMLCASDIVWNLADGCEIKHPFLEKLRGEYYWTRSYFPQYQENSFLPGLIEPISAFINHLDESPLASALLWRPAWYLYLAIICAVLFSRRIRSARGLLLIAPIMGQSLFLLLVNRVQNFRYQYCVVLVGLLLIAIALYNPQSD